MVLKSYAIFDCKFVAKLTKKNNTYTHTVQLHYDIIVKKDWQVCKKERIKRDTDTAIREWWGFRKRPYYESFSLFYRSTNLFNKQAPHLYYSRRPLCFQTIEPT